MSILDYFKRQLVAHRSKHQTHVRKSKRTGFRRGKKHAVANVQATGTKLAKYFAKAKFRGPRGY